MLVWVCDYIKCVPFRVRVNLQARQPPGQPTTIKSPIPYSISPPPSGLFPLYPWNLDKFLLLRFLRFSLHPFLFRRHSTPENGNRSKLGCYTSVLPFQFFIYKLLSYYVAHVTGFTQNYGSRSCVPASESSTSSRTSRTFPSHRNHKPFIQRSRKKKRSLNITRWTLQHSRNCPSIPDKRQSRRLETFRYET